MHKVHGVSSFFRFRLAGLSKFKVRDRYANELYRLIRGPFNTIIHCMLYGAAELLQINAEPHCERDMEMDGSVPSDVRDDAPGFAAPEPRYQPRANAHNTFLLKGLVSGYFGEDLRVDLCCASV
jgi:hypothetical protein